MNMPLLAQLLNDKGSTVLMWGGVLILVVVVGGGLLMLIRRWLKQPLAGGQQDTGFSLSELRAMRDRGEITPEEYEQTRARVIAKVKGSVKKPEQDEGSETSAG